MPSRILSDRSLLWMAEHMQALPGDRIRDIFVETGLGTFDDWNALAGVPMSKKNKCISVLNKANAIPANEPGFKALLKSIDLSGNETLVASLQMDGWDITETDVLPVAAPYIEPAQEESLLAEKLNNHNMGQVLNYLQQSFDNYAGGHYEAANAMARTALETMLKTIAERRAGTRSEAIPAKNPQFGPQPADCRNYLISSGFLSKDEFELLKTFYGFASTNGSHPGTSDSNDARLRRFMTIALCLSYVYKLEANQ